MVLKRIEVLKEIPFEELDGCLRNVSLKGFPDIKIYEDADITIEQFDPVEIRQQIFTPQPSIFKKGFLDRIDHLAGIFLEKGIDIFKLNGGVHYFAYDNNEEKTEWTIIPPVIELIQVKFDGKGLDYSGLIGEAVRKAMDEKGHSLNPELAELDFNEYKNYSGICSIPIICDGSHRVHSGLERNISQNLLVIDAPKLGFPYYAAPKPYSVVHVEEERPEDGGIGKTHVLTEPGHKLLYRLFPTGGILTGVVRSGVKDGN